MTVTNYSLDRDSVDRMTDYAFGPKKDNLQNEVVCLGWVTINGVHVLIGEDGNIEKGPSALVGKKPSEISTEQKPASGDSSNKSTQETSNPVVQSQESWEDGLTKEQSAAIKSYVNFGYDRIKKYQDGRLKEGTTTYLQAKVKSDNLEAAMATAPRTEGVFYRGIKNVSDATADKMTAPGSEFALTSVSSFSKSKKEAEGFADYRVKGKSILYQVKNGSGVDVSNISGRDQEQEVLIGRGTKFKVASRVETHFHDGYIVTLEQVK